MTVSSLTESVILEKEDGNHISSTSDFHRTLKEIDNELGYKVIPPWDVDSSFLYATVWHSLSNAAHRPLTAKKKKKKKKKGKKNPPKQGLPLDAKPKETTNYLSIDLKATWVSYILGTTQSIEEFVIIDSEA